MTESIQQRIHNLQQEIPDQVRLIAVSKQVPCAAMRMAYQAGIRDFGESRLQEAIEKQAQLADLADITWHFLGHVQSNKARKIVQHFQWIHAVDRLKLAQKLDRLITEQEANLQVCLQVKLKPDPNKHGWDRSELLTDLNTLDQCQQLNVQGLMTILPLGLSAEEELTTFQALQQLAQEISTQPWQHLQMKQLSMGMSRDYGLAIQAGATMVRLGRCIFGVRPV